MDNQDKDALRILPALFVCAFVYLVWLRDKIEHDRELPTTLRAVYRSLVVGGILLLFAIGWRMLLG